MRNSIDRNTLRHFFYSNVWVLGCLALFLLSLLVFTQFNHLPDIRVLQDSSMGWLFDVVLMLILFSPVVLIFTFNGWRTLNIIEKFHLVSLALFLISTVYSVRTGINMGAIFFVCTFVLFLQKKKIYAPSIPFYFFWAYFVINFLSLSWSSDLNWGLNKIRIFIPWLSFSLAFLFFRLNQATFQRLLLVYFRSILIFTTLCLCCWAYESQVVHFSMFKWFTIQKTIFGLEHEVFKYIYSWLYYEHPSYNAIIYMLGSAISFYLLKQRRISRFEYIVFILAAICLVLITQSRVGIVMMLMVLGCELVYEWRHSIKKIVILIVLMSVFAFLLLHYTSIVPDFIHDDIRKQLISIAIEYISAKPLSGSGVGGMTCVDIDATIHRACIDTRYPDFYPHNQFLGDWMQGGIFSLLALIGILGSLFYVSIRQRKYLLGLFLICMLLFMCIEMPFYLLKGTTFFVLFCCLFLVDEKGDKII
jgi:hypothetical protein